MHVKQFTWMALGGWLAVTLALGAGGAFVTSSGRPPLPILLGATLPLAAFLAAYLGSDAFRAFVLSADLRVLATIQAWRLGGLMFLALYAHDVLPGLFAWPAGLGDTAVALAAPFIVLRLSRDAAFARSRRFVLWNMLGILDLAVAVSIGALASGIVPGLAGPLTTAAMAEMPLVLVPAFFVPLFVMLHLAALLQARRTPAGAGWRHAAVPA